ESKHPSLPLARAERKPLDRKKNIPRATSARTCLKKTKHYCNIALIPRHRREYLLPQKNKTNKRGVFS
ncbi:hypothetical protein LKD23_11630, partial [Faecalibacterium sp. CLA-AA-H233]